MNPVARLLIGAGVLLIALGVLWQLGSRLPGGFALGKLPGDIAIERENFRFYFPVTTCVLLSALVSLILLVVKYFSK